MNAQSTPSKPGIGKRILFFLKFLEVRLRFVAVLVVTALVVGYWDTIQNHYERWQRHRHHEGGSAGAISEAPESDKEYFCPMHPFVVRDHPDKCPICGMDLSQRKRGEAVALPAGVLSRVQVSPNRILQAGVEVEPVAYRLLVRAIQSYGVIEPNETKVSRIIARFPGRIEELKVNYVGEVVKSGDPLARIYSPRFLAAVEEYLQARRTSEQVAADARATDGDRRRASQLAHFAAERLRLAGLTSEQLAEFDKAGAASDSITLYSPLSGTVLEKNAWLGQSVEEGTVLYSVTDLSTVWVQVMVVESEVSAVSAGMPVEITSVAFPGRVFYGTVDFIEPTVNAENRTVKVRVVVDNHDGQLKPGMYVNAGIRSPVGEWGPAGADVSITGTDSMASHMHEHATDSATTFTLPTVTQEAADQFLASLPAGAEYYMCPMDPQVVSDRGEVDCPICGMHLKKTTKSPNPSDRAAPSVASALEPTTDRWAVGYACSMHPDQLGPSPGICTICGCGMEMQKLRVERVLSIPETAVIDTGLRQVVYVKEMPGIFDSRAVTLGQRTGHFYPVLAGLALGDRIVSRGSFLIDAEARLNPSLVTTAPALETGNTSAPAAHQHAH